VRFASLASGSRGNALLVEGDGTRLLLDCGLPLRELEARLARLGVDPQTLDGVLVTHEHKDHIRGVGPLARRHRLPVWMTTGTWRHGGCGELPSLHLIHPHQTGWRIGNLAIDVLPIPHDAREPVQYRLSSGGRRLGVLTDAGHVTPHLREALQDCDALLLECNHDPQMLANGPYPPALRRRVGGAYGHLSNPQAAELLSRMDTARLRHLVALHLSEKNNHPRRVEDCLREAAPALGGRLSIASQEEIAGWFEL
jgi:phosphoribosyl 1,2-cyclic phosphodiesterase